jgi:SET domain-containing protein
MRAAAFAAALVWSVNMLLVPTYVRPSRVEGVGVFAAEEIPAGTLIWRLDERFDRLIHRRDVADQPETVRQFIERYAYPYPHDPDLLIVELDNGRFMNHSDEPNTDFLHPDAGFTRRAIAADEELLCNYSEFDPGFAMLPGRIYREAQVSA